MTSGDEEPDADYRVFSRNSASIARVSRLNVGETRGQIIIKNSCTTLEFLEG